MNISLLIVPLAVRYEIRQCVRLSFTCTIRSLFRNFDRFDFSKTKLRPPLRILWPKSILFAGNAYSEGRCWIGLEDTSTGSCNSGADCVPSLKKLTSGTPIAADPFWNAIQFFFDTSNDEGVTIDTIGGGNYRITDQLTSVKHCAICERQC